VKCKTSGGTLEVCPTLPFKVSSVVSEREEGIEI